MVIDQDAGLAERIRTLRTREGWTLQELADRSSVSRATLEAMNFGRLPTYCMIFSPVWAKKSALYFFDSSCNHLKMAFTVFR